MKKSIIGTIITGILIGSLAQNSTQLIIAASIFIIGQALILLGFYEVVQSNIL